MSAAALTEIRLLSTLGKRYGRTHWVNLDRKTPAEAMRWLLSQFPDARRYFATAHERGIRFAVFRGRGKQRENIGEAELREPAEAMITFTQIMEGSKSGVLQTIVGAALIAASFIPALAPIAPYLMNAGIAMVAGGVVQMLTPIPKLGKQADSADNQSSYLFNGPVNTTAQGNCVPLVYGKIRAGSAVISAGMSSEEYVPNESGIDSGTAGGSSKKTPYELEA